MLFGGRGEAQEEVPLPLTTVFKAIACYGNLNYDCVVELLSSIPSSYPGARPSEGMRAVDLPVALEVGRILGVSYLALNQENSARETFRWLLALDEGFVMSGTEISPAYSRIFYEERAFLKGGNEATTLSQQALVKTLTLAMKGSGEQVAHRVSKLPLKVEASDTLQLIMSPFVDVSWVSLSGQDAEVFDDTLGFGVGVGFAHEGGGLHLEASLGYSEHNVSLENLLDVRQRTLQFAHLVGTGGYEWRLGRVGLRPVVGVGFASYGVLSATDQIASQFSAGHVLTVRFLAGAQIYLRVEGVGLLTLFDDVWLTSALLKSSVGLGVGF